MMTIKERIIEKVECLWYDSDKDFIEFLRDLCGERFDLAFDDVDDEYFEELLDKEIVSN